MEYYTLQHIHGTNKAATIVVRKAIIAYHIKVDILYKWIIQKFRIIKKNVGWHPFEKHITNIISSRFTSSKSVL